MGGKLPPGFDRNPMAWPKQILFAFLAFAGLCISVYLTLFQVRVFSSVWDPFLRTAKVLTFLGFPDASLGALAYGTEIVLTLAGGRHLWRTMPWTVLAFGFLILSGALVGVLLILMQASLVGAWCALCLASATISLATFVFGYDEPLAGLVYPGQVREAGGPVWRALWGLQSGKEELRV